MSRLTASSCAFRFPMLTKNLGRTTLSRTVEIKQRTRASFSAVTRRHKTYYTGYIFKRYAVVFKTSSRLSTFRLVSHADLVIFEELHYVRTVRNLSLTATFKTNTFT